ncbi:MAG: TfoX/Sxy family protein [Pirellulaceae bacterium]|nr:TfoX/Sxy family protein [Pirellulaceae bacterium]
MAFDETLAGRIRDALARMRNVEERKMFGCICFLLNGNALAGVWKDRLIARLIPSRTRATNQRRCSSPSLPLAWSDMNPIMAGLDFADNCIYK